MDGVIILLHERVDFEYLSRVVGLCNRIVINEEIEYNRVILQKKNVGQEVGIKIGIESGDSIDRYTFTSQGISSECRNRLSSNGMLSRVNYLNSLIEELLDGKELHRHEMAVVNEIYKQLIAKGHK
jgi:hypothetical protein